MQVDLRVAQLLCSRLCHDLVGPVGAVNAGLELMEEGGDGLDDAASLVSRSAAQVTRRLTFFRVAFGLGGGSGGEMGLAEVRKLASDFLAGGNVALDWPEDETVGGNVSSAAGKLLLNMILLGNGSLQRGGALEICVADLPEGMGVAMTAVGTKAAIKDDVRLAMSPEAPVGDLSAYNIHGHFAACLAADLGLEMEIASDREGEVRLAILLPAGQETG